MAVGIRPIPRAVPRAAGSSRWFAGLIGGLTLLVVWGLVAWIYQLRTGLAATGMQDVVTWGMYIFTFAFFVGLAAGGLIVASAAEVFNVAALRPLARLGALTAAACVAVAAIMVLPDLGHPERVFGLFIHPNLTSPLIWDVAIIIAYFVLATVDLTLMQRRDRDAGRRARIIRIVAYIGLPTAVLLHSITAWIFGLQIARLWWNTALMAPLFVTSAILSGTALIAVILLAATRFGGARPAAATWRHLTGIMAVALAVDLFLVGCEYLTIFYGNVPREKATLDLILPGGSWQSLFWLEWIVGGLVPFVLLAVPRLRHRGWVVGTAAALILVGVYAFRIELVATGLARPLIQLPPGNALGVVTPAQSTFQYEGLYFPTWTEVSIVAGLCALFTLVVIVGVRRLRLLREITEATP